MSEGKCYYDEEGKLFELNNESNSLQEIDIEKGKKCIREINGEKYIILLPLSTTLVVTEEVIGIGNNIGGTCHSKVGIVSYGIGDIGTMFGPNFCGHFLISLHNVTDRPFKIKVGTTIVSLVFHYLKTPIDEKNHTDNAHIEKMASLGVSLNAEETDDLNSSWKCKLNDIRTKMKEESTEYKNYMNKLEKRRFSIKNRNRIGLLIMFLIGGLCYFLDLKTNSDVWTKRFWDVWIVTIISIFYQNVKGKN